MRSVMRREVGEEEIGLGRIRAYAQGVQLRRELLGPGAQLRGTGMNLVLMLKRGDGRRLTGAGERVGVVVAVQVVGDGLSGNMA